MRVDKLYLITGTAALMGRLVPRGVRLVQLRAKGLAPPALRAEVQKAQAICAAHGAQLVLNDHWELALELGCTAVHLGQEDIDQADLPALRRAGVAFGLSTHDEPELERALACAPAYVALGPIWETLLKPMACRPQGLARVAQWRRAVGDMPLVAIGGITPARVADVLAAGADCAAVVTDIAQAACPEARLDEWRAAIAEAR